MRKKAKDIEEAAKAALPAMSAYDAANARYQHRHGVPTASAGTHQGGPAATALPKFNPQKDYAYCAHCGSGDWTYLGAGLAGPGTYWVRCEGCKNQFNREQPDGHVVFMSREDADRMQREYQNAKRVDADKVKRLRKKTAFQRRKENDNAERTNEATEGTHGEGTTAPA